MLKKFSCEEYKIALEDIVNPVDGATSEAELAELVALRVRAKPAFNDMLAAFGDGSAIMLSGANEKAETTILAKARRPEILNGKPWYRVRHIRDALRARGSFDRIDDLFDTLAIAAKLQDSDRISVVKFDFDKFFRPKIWGWRMVALDIRLIPAGFITEFYASYSAMIEVNQKVAHRYYEKWRDVDQETMRLIDRREFERDVAFCRNLYDDALRRSLSADDSDVLSMSKRTSRVTGGVRSHVAVLEKVQIETLKRIEEIFRRLSAAE